MKVLINVPDLSYPGGVSKYFQTAKGLFKLDVTYFTIGGRVKNKSLWSHLSRLMADYVLFMRTIRREKYEVIHLNPSLDVKAVLRDGIFLIGAKYFNIKVITFWHGWNDDFYRSLCIRYWTIYLFKKVFFKSDAFIVLANDVRDKLLVLGYAKPIYVETTLVDEKDVGNIDDVPKIHKETVCILFLCTIIKEKGIYEAIDAYSIIRNESTRVHLEIAGDGKELQNAKAYVREKYIEGVSFCGYLRGEKKVRAFANADIYLLPSYGEGMPISVLEAMASGLPIITTKVGGIKDFFIEGKMGFFVEKKNSEDLAGKLRILVNNEGLRKDISIFNFHYAKDKFISWKVLKRLEKIYQEIYRNNGRYK